jgi:hypothetical protein
VAVHHVDVRRLAARIGRDDLVIVVAPVGGQRVDGDAVELFRSAALMIDWMMQASPVLVVVSVPASSQAPKKRPSETSWALTPVTAMAPSAVPINRCFMVFLPRIGALAAPVQPLVPPAVMARTT